MKFYVAGKFGERLEVRDFCSKLVSKGHEITKDWTSDEESDNGFPVINVVEDTRGVAMADAYIGRFLNPHIYKGALVEMGMAIGLRRNVYIIGHAMDECIFIHHPLVHRFDSEDEFIEYIEGAF